MGACRFLDSVSPFTRTPHGVCVEMSKRSRIDHRSRNIERLALGQGVPDKKSEPVPFKVDFEDLFVANLENASGGAVQ